MAQLADFLQTNLLMIGDQRLEIGLDVRHLRDQPGYLRQLLDSRAPWLQQAGQDTPERPGDDEHLQETLCTGSYGLGLVVATRSRTARGRLVRSVSVPSRPEIDVADHGPGLRTFTGEAVPNPSYLYTGRRILEGLVVVGSHPVIPTAVHGIHNRRILSLIAQVAYENLHAPIVMLQAPAQVPTRGHSESRSSLGEDLWPRSYSIAVRFAIAVGELSAERRRQALSPLIEYCESHGFGLALLDPRPSHRAGNWFWLVEGSSHSEPASSAQPLHAAYPITFVGPARIGATAAIMRCLDEFDDLAVISTSATALADLAFVSVWVGLTHEQWKALSGDLNRWHALRDLQQADAFRALASVLSALGVRRAISNENERRFVERAHDYAACHGPIMRTNYNSSQASHCVWFSVDGPQTKHALQHALTALYSAASEILAQVSSKLGETLPDGRPVRLGNIDYLIARVNNAGGLRSRGKFAIPDVILEELMPSMSNERRGTLLSRRLEEEWYAQLAAQATFDISVAWRENWLGHWGRSSQRHGQPLG